MATAVKRHVPRCLSDSQSPQRELPSLSVCCSCRPVAAEPAPPSSQGQPGPGNCISRSPTGQLTVLAAGDSITQGSVPSKNFNHPYTIKMEQVLEAGQQTDVRAVDAGGCAGYTCAAQAMGRDHGC